MQFDNKNKTNSFRTTSGLGSKISVCLLTFNHEDLIESTLKSIQEQTVDGYEIIVSDDCSTDKTWLLILAIAAHDSRIKPIRTPRNIGMAANANYAVSQSNRPYIALLHHDDIYRNDLLEKWATVIDKYHDVTYVFNPYDAPNSEYHYGKRFNTDKLNGHYFLENYLFKRWGCPVRGTAMIRRAAWNEIGGMRLEFDLLADVDMWMRLSEMGSVGYVSEPVISPRHQRPSDYPEEYKQTSWSWRRHRILYEIHAINRLSHLKLNTLTGRIKWWGFRLKLSFDTTKWLVYAVVRKKPTMITTSDNSVTDYDLLPLRLFRSALKKCTQVVHD
jgi:glycosyltransferase involved in cell wall biosynthesis